jgi:hypothetical protein
LNEARTRSNIFRSTLGLEAAGEVVLHQVPSPNGVLAQLAVTVSLTG